MSSGNQERTAGMAAGLSLLIPVTLSTMAIVLLAPIVPQLMAEFKDEPGHEYLVPMILTVPALCVALLSPVAGILGDRVGRRNLLIVSMLVYALVGVAPVFLTGLTDILISRVAVGIAEAFIMVLTTTLIGDYFKGESRDKWLAAQTAVASLSALLFFNLGGFLGAISWRAPFWVYGSAVVMMLAVLAFTWEPSKSENSTTASGKASGAPAGQSDWAGFPWALMIGILAVTIFSSIMFYAVQIQASSGLAKLGLTDPAKIGMLTAAAALGVPLGTIIYSRVRSLRVPLLLLAEFVLFTIGFQLMSRLPTVEGFLIGCFICQLASGMLLPTLLVWSMSPLKFEVRGRGVGMWQSSFFLGQFLSPIAVTFIASHHGGLMGSFGVLSLGALAASVFTLGSLLFLSKPRAG